MANTRMIHQTLIGVIVIGLGLAGCSGEAGPRGRTGATGPVGLVGEQGEPGTPGQPGASGVVQVLGFDDNANGVDMSGVPDICRTAVHTAGPNEVAAMSFQVTANTGTSSDGYLLFAATAVSDDAGSTFAVGTSHWAIYVANSLAAVAHASTSGRVELVEGNDYVFGPSLAGGVTTANIICTGVVTIARVE